MVLLYLLLALQTAAVTVGGVYLWRRQQALSAEIERLCDAQAAAEAGAAVKTRARRAGAANVVSIAADETVAERAPPLARAHRAWNLTSAPSLNAPAPFVSPETARGLMLGLMALAPALGFAFNAGASVVVACGLAIGAAMITIGHRPLWRAAAWAGVATSGAWALIGFAISAAHADPISYSVCVSLAAVVGLVHAHLHRVTPGVTLALAMTAAMLALASQIGMVSAAGVAFGVIVAAAAITGALSLRLESLHLAAFGSALIGLFVLSGQPSAAIWFTPAAAWAGALFFAIAAIRVPQIGARGVAIAGAGALAPLAAIAALYISQHGLADRFAAAAAFAALALMLGGLIAAAALRRARGLAALKVTLWVLAAGAFIAFAAAVSLALPASAAVAAFALAGLGLAALNLSTPSAAWRVFACVSATIALLCAAFSARELLTESSNWPAFAGIALGFVAPALLVGAAAYTAALRSARGASAFLEFCTLVLALAGANLFARVIYSGSAVLLEPISFAEAGAHIGIWLTAALLIRWRARFGARALRIGAANTLLVTSLGAIVGACALWALTYWTARQSPAPFISHETLGFLLPSVLFFAHWRLWRSRAARIQAQLSLAAGALLLAAFISVEAARLSGGVTWISAVVGALTFSTAIGLNFIPGALRRRQTSK